MRRVAMVVGATVVVAVLGLEVGPVPAGAVEVASEAEWVAAFEDPAVAAIELGADIELGCGSYPTRPAGAVPVVIDGGDHRITDGCLGRASMGTTLLSSPSTWRDVTLVGAPDGFANVMMTDEIHLERVAVVVRNGGIGLYVLGVGSTIVDTTIDVQASGTGLRVFEGEDVVIDRLQVRGAGDGVSVGDLGSDETRPVTIRDSVIDVTRNGLLSEGATVLERSSVRAGSLVASITSGAPLTISDSTLVVDAAFGRVLVTGSGSEIDLDQVTVVAPPDGFAAIVGASSRVTMHATVLAGGTCVVLGELASTGDDVATDASCATDGAGDRVLADPGIEPYDPASGTAAPVAAGPLVDAVAVCGSAADQLGQPRPSGSACDIGAVELQVAAPPTPSTTTTTTSSSSVPAGPLPASPARPVVGPTDFAG